MSSVHVVKIDDQVTDIIIFFTEDKRLFHFVVLKNSHFLKKILPFDLFFVIIDAIFLIFILKGSFFDN